MNTKAPLKWWILLLMPFCGSAQINSGFIAHLQDLQLKAEHRAYLNTLQASPDSLHYEEARYNLLYFNDSLFLQHFEQAQQLCRQDSQLMKKAHLAFLNCTTKRADTWFSREAANTSPNNSAELNRAYRASVNPLPFRSEDFPEPLRKTFDQYRRDCRKKPGLAMAFSAIIPGSGKWYAGRGRSFLMAFTINAAYAAQSIESYQKLGLKHPLTMINLGAFAVFYLSNIYGSYADIKQSRKESKKQWIVESLQYYN